MNKRHLVLLLAVIAISACKRDKGGDGKSSQPTPEQTNAQIILKIADREFTNDHLKQYVQSRYSQVVTEQENPRLLKIIFERFAEEKLLLEKINQEGVTVSEEEIASYLKSINIADTQQLDRDETINTLKIQKYLLQHVYDSIKIKETEIEQYYQDHLTEYEKKEEIFLHQIMVKDKEKAIQIRTELMNSPQRFETIARRDSESPEATEGGQMGLFEKGDLPLEMESVVFSLKVGNISPVVETPFGFHIFKVTQHRGAKRMTYQQVKPTIQEKLLSERMTTAYQGFIERIKSDIPFLIMEENLYFPKSNLIPNGETNE